MQDPEFSINPDEIGFLMFEATRGLKGQSNYFWNDQYTLAEAGTPYDPVNEPENIYELDTLRAGLTSSAPITPLPPPRGSAHSASGCSA